MRRAALVFIVAMVAALGVPSAVAASTQGVVVQNFGYTPPTITVRVGDTVSFLNKDPFAHTATGDKGEFDTSPACNAQHADDESCLKPDAPVEIRFDNAGTIAYHCKIHSSMHGTIVVEAADTTTTSSSTTTSTTSTTTTTTAPTSTTDTTTTTSSTTSTSTTTTISSASGAVGISGTSNGGGSSAVPLLIGAIVVIAAIAALAYWRWSQGRYGDDDDGFWLDDPPPTTQGPRV